MNLRVFAVAAALCVFVSPASAADEGHLEFSIYLFGFKLGVLRVDVAQTPTEYAAKGRVKTTGMFAKVANFNFDGEVRGHKDGAQYWPDDYTASITKKSGTQTVRMRYDNRVPRVVEYAPKREPRDNDVDPAKQRGAVDLISSAYMIMRDVPAAELCDASVQMFDGRRRSEISTSKPAFDGDKASCAGVYHRIAGFTVNEMADKTVFPFTLYYEKQKDGIYRLTTVETDSVIGAAKMVRRN